MLIKPKQLQEGDTVAAISLSWGGAAAFPYRFNIGVERLKDIFKLNVVPTKHALESLEWLSENPQAKARDLIDAFLDPEVKGIISVIGGNDSIKILPHIDFNVIKDNPKVFLGFSDSTITHFICLKAGLASFYGPSIMTGFAENFTMHPSTVSGIKKALFSTKPIGDLEEPQEGWTKEMLPWESPDNQLIQRKLNEPLTWNFNYTNKAITKGRLIGGCIDVFPRIVNTNIWPAKEKWQDTILFIELSEEGMDVLAFSRILRDLAKQDVLQKINAILFSKPGGVRVSTEKFSSYEDAILKVLKQYNIQDMIVVTNMDFGHTDPILTMPYGCLVEVNATKKTISILESGVS